MDDSDARRMWTVLEPLHVVTYFSPESLGAFKEVGLRGFWMGYFGGRAAPLGPVAAGVVEATFFGFHPARVRRAVPDAWGFAAPEAILRARSEAAAANLRRVAPGIEDAAPEIVPLLARVVDAADGAGRPLFAANRDLGLPDDPVEALWQLATSLREHRGDGHVAALTAEGLGGLEANVLASGVGAVPGDMVSKARGWSEEEWREASAALAARGLLDGDAATGTGRALRAEVERRTDALAAPPFRVLDDPEGLYRTLVPFARAVADAGEVPFPNPVGVPRVD
ncbi:SCO6745 family protein [Actinomadura litoris]|uniref:SalK n=1 Tax=Actinomadura litoris TaxID=2678616 RepID=A0A7K1L6N1_9ACTN|nr:hypothetical protein [Actinomadura litoris]MUN40058.1 hypothetical protein [Actinomadura litoris]